jgi:hypothetical protein
VAEVVHSDEIRVGNLRSSLFALDQPKHRLRPTGTTCCRDDHEMLNRCNIFVKVSKSNPQRAKQSSRSKQFHHLKVPLRFSARKWTVEPIALAILTIPQLNSKKSAES